MDSQSPAQDDAPYKTWLCVVCGVIYDEAQGWPQDGIAPGTRWEDVPEDWVCPECQAAKADFEMLDVSEVVAAAPASASPTLTPSVAPEAPNTPLSLPVPQIAQPIVIIGSGHAGYGLAQALRQIDADVDIRVLTADSGHRYHKPGLSVGLGLGRSPDAMADESPFAIEARLHIRVYPHCLVEGINPATRQVHTNLGALAYGQLVLACGARPVRLALGADAADVLSINNLADYRQFRQRLAGAHRVAIIGDGLIGCEFANDLAASGHAVQVIGLARWPMERFLPVEAGRHVQNALAALGVNWHLGASVQRVERHVGVYRLTLNDARLVQADLIVSAVGLQANLDLARSAGIRVGRGIWVDDALQTSHPGIYALGDCVEIGGQMLPFLAPIDHGIRALAPTLLGQVTPVEYPPMPITVKTPAVPLCLLPPAVHVEGTWQVTTAPDGLTAGFYDRDETLHGFVLLGRAQQVQRGTWLQAYQRQHQEVA